MKAKNITLQAACDYVGEYSNELMDRYLSAKARMPSWTPEVDSDLSRYFGGAEHWVRGNLE